MTTDVAEAAPTPITEVPVVAPATEAVVPDAPAGVTPDVQAEAEAAPDTGFDVTSLPEYQEVVKAVDPEIAKAAAAPELPGTPVEVARQQIEQRRAQRQAFILQSNDQQMRDYLTNQLGLAPADAHSLWHQALGPMLRDALGDNNSYTNAVFNSAVAQFLPEEGQKKYNGQVLNSLPDKVKAVYTVGQATERAAWEAKLGTQLFTKAQMEKIARASHDRGLGIAEGNGEVPGSNEGQVPGSTRAAGNSRYRTKMEARTLHVQGKISNSQMRAINANPGIPEI